MSKKIFFAMFFTVIIISAFLSSIYLHHEVSEMGMKSRDNGNVGKITETARRPIVSWQQVTTTILEAKREIVISINVPKVIISGNDYLSSEINKAITRRIESLKNDFVFAVSTAADDNGETNTLDINTETLLITTRLVSFAFTATEHLAGIQVHNPEWTFLAFDLVDNRWLREGNEVFQDDYAWARAVSKMKSILLAQYSEKSSCDFMFAPRNNGFAASCIGVDFSNGAAHIAVAGDIPISAVQEFVKPSILSHIMSD